MEIITKLEIRLSEAHLQCKAKEPDTYDEVDYINFLCTLFEIQNENVCIPQIVTLLH